MITLKSSHEIDLMRQAGKITAAARALAGEMVRPGVTTQEIDKAVEEFIRKQGAVPSFLGYSGYPASACISVNDEVIHGIPGKRVLREGDIVSVDVGAYIPRRLRGDLRLRNDFRRGSESDRCDQTELLRGNQVRKGRLPGAGHFSSSSDLCRRSWVLRRTRVRRTRCGCTSARITGSAQLRS